MKKKRRKTVVALGWMLIGLASFLFYNAAMVISEILLLPWPLNYIMAHSQPLKSLMMSALATLLFSVMFFAGALGLLCVKRWAVRVVVLAFIFEFIKRFFIAGNVSPHTMVLIGIEGVFFIFLVLICLPKKFLSDFS